MKRTLTLLLAVFLLLFVGCSTTKNNKTEEPTAPKEEAVNEEAANEEAVNEEAAKEEAVNEEAVNEAAAGEAAANEETVKEEAAEDEPQESDVVGIRMDMSEMTANAKGTLIPNPIGAFDEDRSIYVMPIYYIAMPKDEASAILYDMDASDEDMKKLLVLFSLVLSSSFS